MHELDKLLTEEDLDWKKMTVLLIDNSSYHHKKAVHLFLVSQGL